MLQPGTALTVGRHNVTVVRHISDGGFSHIYEVAMGEKSACLKQVRVADKSGLGTLRKEVEVMKSLRRARGIVAYHDLNAERLPDGLYQVLVLMELCGGGSLLDYMNARLREKLKEAEIIDILYDIGLAVYEMHRRLLVHRDIKIENVLIDDSAKSSCRFKLCDFGLVLQPTRPPQHPQEMAALARDIMLHTTPQYRLPEMVDLYRALPLDERADMWALGCFLYKLCYYTTPFEAAGDIALLHALYLFLQQPQYLGDLKNLIVILLQEDPLYRPNIVQLLILVCRIKGVDFAQLGVDDFYRCGEYSFQALHEMQRRKQKELVAQRQRYEELYERRAPPEPRGSSPTLSVEEPREKDTGAAPAGTPAPASGVSPSNRAFGLPEHDHDLEIPNLELPNLKDTEERFPALEALGAHYDKKEPDASQHDKKEPGASQYESKEAWQRPDRGMDRNAELLVETVFIRPPLQQDLHEDRRKLEKLFSEHLLGLVELLRLALPAELPEIQVTLPVGVPDALIPASPEFKPRRHEEHETLKREFLNPWKSLLQESQREEVNLIDLDATEREKPQFTKRVLDMHLREEVIDFESDDENRKLDMSRLAIRNSLRKLRRSGEYKRSERRSDSSHGESRKRLSFFGD